MTAVYEWKPMPHCLDIRCPECSRLATFEFAEMVKIQLKKDVPFFQNHSLFDYAFFRDSCGNGWHAAIFFAGLRISHTSALTDLPEGYEPSAWDHSRYLHQSRGNGNDLGTVVCRNCSLRRKHTLSWPNDAYFQIDSRGKVLWAYHRESAIDLRNYLESVDRKQSGYKWELFLRHVPGDFLVAGLREQQVKLLDRLLRG